MHFIVKTSGRADFALKELNISTRGIKNLFEEGRVLKGKKKLKQGEPVAIGEKLEILFPEEDASGFDLEIVHEENDFLIINKPTAIHSVSVKLSNISIEGELKKKYPNYKMISRLDLETSGLIIALKDGIKKDKFVEIKKGYQALTKGKPELGLITAPIYLKRDADKVYLEEVKDSKRVDSATNVLAAKSYQNANLVEVEILSGARHQIRVHLASLGEPLIGDYKYGSKENLLDYIPDSIRPFLLHAFKVTFKDGQVITKEI